MGQSSYEHWRAKIPFNNAQIEIALQDISRVEPSPFLSARYARAAAHLGRTGRLTAFAYKLALPILVKTCEFCYKRALYRIGAAGRCRDHRDRRTAKNRVGHVFREIKSQAIDDNEKAFTRRQLQAIATRQHSRAMRYPGYK